jgi:hypothetical protein
MSGELWGPIEPSAWDSVPVTRGRLATEADVRAGCAVFCLAGAEEPDAAPLDVLVPALAVLRDEQAQSGVIVVAIQAERSFEKQLVGYRFLNGGNGICTLGELEWIDTSDSRFRDAAREQSRPPAG